MSCSDTSFSSQPAERPYVIVVGSDPRVVTVLHRNGRKYHSCMTWSKWHYRIDFNMVYIRCCGKWKELEPFEADIIKMVKFLVSTL